MTRRPRMIPNMTNTTVQYNFNSSHTMVSFGIPSLENTRPNARVAPQVPAHISQKIWVTNSHHASNHFGRWFGTHVSGAIIRIESVWDAKTAPCFREFVTVAHPTMLTRHRVRWISLFYDTTLRSQRGLECDMYCSLDSHTRTHGPSLGQSTTQGRNEWECSLRSVPDFCILTKSQTSCPYAHVHVMRRQRITQLRHMPRSSVIVVGL